MSEWHTWARIVRIQRILVKYGLDEIITEVHLLRPLRFFFYVFPRRGDRSAPRGERIRLALEELGPIFVKFGQAISTRRDLLPPDIADELGFLIQAQIPIGCVEKSDDIQGHCVAILRETVLRNRNHPSIGIWGILHNSGEARLIKDDLVRVARELDPTRLG